MAIIEVNSQDHEREFDLSYSSDEPTIGGGKGGTTEPLICNITVDGETGKVTTDKTAGELYSAIFSGRRIMFDQTMVDATIKTFPLFICNVASGENDTTYSFVVYADYNMVFQGEDFAEDDTVVLTLPTEDNP